MTKEELVKIVNDYSNDSKVYQTYLTLDEIKKYSKEEEEYVRKIINRHNIDLKNNRLFINYIFDLKENKTKIAVCKYTAEGYAILFFMEPKYWDYIYTDFEFLKNIIVEHEKTKREKFNKYLSKLSKSKFSDSEVEYFQITLSKTELKDFSLQSYLNKVVKRIGSNKLVDPKKKKKLEKEGILKPDIPFLTTKDFESLKEEGNITFGFSVKKGYMDYFPTLKNGLYVLPAWPFYLSDKPVSWGIEFFDNLPLFLLENIKNIIDKFSYKRILLP